MWTKNFLAYPVPDVYINLSVPLVAFLIPVSLNFIFKVTFHKHCHLLINVILFFMFMTDTEISGSIPGATRFSE